MFLEEMSNLKYTIFFFVVYGFASNVHLHVSPIMGLLLHLFEKGTWVVIQLRFSLRNVQLKLEEMSNLKYRIFFVVCGFAANVHLHVSPIMGLLLHLFEKGTWVVILYFCLILSTCAFLRETCNSNGGCNSTRVARFSKK
jgi:hypothetical protein